MWRAVTDILEAEGVTVNQAETFFVGDAAGRKRDHSASDRKFAINVGIRFHTPEVRTLIALRNIYNFCARSISSRRLRSHFNSTGFIRPVFVIVSADREYYGLLY